VVAEDGATYAPAEVIVPFAADQVTDVSEAVPLTLAEKVALPPVETDVDAGVIEIEVMVGRPSVTVAEADFVLSALLVAVTVIVAAEAPPVKRPACETAPLDADHVTDLSATFPCTAAVNCCVASVRMFAVVGEMETPVTVGALTVTEAEADFVLSARLVAVTVTLPAVAGAVRTPAAEMVPAEVDHVMPLLETLPTTLALNCCVAPVAMLAVVGEMETEFTTGAATVTTALAVFVGSARLVTVIVAVPGVAAAVKTPEEEIVPELVDQAMDLLLTVPWTVALNCSVPPVATDAVVGEMVMEFTTGVATVIVAVADFVASAALVAVIVAVPAVVDAVKRPLELIVPDEVFQVTDLLEVVPWMAAVSCSVAPVTTEAAAGVSEIDETAGAVAAIVTLAEADFVGSKTLVAVMVAEPVFAGAV
jgi:molybdopterin biosynthesis enzyme MoaB